jgi:hypothetical protein
VARTVVSESLLQILLVPIVAVWVLHLYQRTFKDAGVRKRAATLWLTFLLIGAWAAAWVFDRFGIDDVWLVAVALVAIAVVVWQRRILLPFRGRCSRCGKAVPMIRMLCQDSNTCEACEPRRREGETPR